MLLAVACSVALLGLAACGDDESSGSDEPATESESSGDTGGGTVEDEIRAQLEQRGIVGDDADCVIDELPEEGFSDAQQFAQQLLDATAACDLTGAGAN